MNLGLRNEKTKNGMRDEKLRIWESGTNKDRE